MYILYEVHYPDRPVSKSEAETHWKAAALPGSLRCAGPEAKPDEIRAAVRAVLEAAGASRMEKNGDMEVPNSALETLKKLEALHFGLYPEMRTDRSRNSFHYESLEWLGEF